MFDAAVALNLVASVMMNGVCCVHSMHEEEERQQKQEEVIRTVISDEYKRQREEFERECQERIVERGVLARRLATERRHRLMEAKTNCNSSGNNLSRNSSHKQLGLTAVKEDDIVMERVVTEEGSWINGGQESSSEEALSDAMDRKELMMSKQGAYLPTSYATQRQNDSYVPRGERSRVSQQQRPELIMPEMRKQSGYFRHDSFATDTTMTTTNTSHGDIVRPHSFA